MNKLFLVLIAMTMCLSCTSKGEYTIKGTASKDLDGKKVYLKNKREDGVERIDSTEIKAGKFSFQGVLEKPALYFLSLGKVDHFDNPAYPAPLLIEPGQITIGLSSNEVKIGGTPVNIAFQKKIDAEAKLFERMKMMEQKYVSVNPATLSAEEIQKINNEYAAFEDSVKILNLNFATENINNPLGEGVFLSLINYLSLEQIEMVINNAGDDFKSKETGKMIINMADRMKRVSVGQKFIDLTMPDISGKEISISDYAGNGKYVLIDFWASWCGPCIAEIPTFIEAYKLYKDKNFEIVGISLDAKAESWKAAIRKNNMEWPQMSDLKQWKSKAVENYNLNSIPHTILLDPNGIIIAKNLRGAELMEKLRELIESGI